MPGRETGLYLQKKPYTDRIETSSGMKLACKARKMLTSVNHN